MQITILNVGIETKPTAKGSYQVAVVAYKNDQGKVEGKNVFSFGATAETFKALSVATSGQVFNITTVKNDKGYWDWTKAEASTGAASAPQQQNKSAGNQVPRSNYETPEERAQRQIYIIRQSSIANAISALSVGSKSAPKDADILALAKTFENFVFDGLNEAPAKEVIPLDGFEDMDIPL